MDLGIRTSSRGTRSYSDPRGNRRRHPFVSRPCVMRQPMTTSLGVASLKVPDKGLLVATYIRHRFSRRSRRVGRARVPVLSRRTGMNARSANETPSGRTGASRRPRSIAPSSLAQPCNVASEALIQHIGTAMWLIVQVIPGR
ncbi:MAG: hypothetical protein QOE07_2 [Acidimicrobiaceae bacterium]|nr:hypothetical protein [Acidimicrobiaceae bacterium]